MENKSTIYITFDHIFGTYIYWYHSFMKEVIYFFDSWLKEWKFKYWRFIFTKKVIFEEETV